MITFKANLSALTNIKQLTGEQTYKNIPAAFVELQIDSEDDLNALETIAYDWQDGDIYARDVYERFRINYEEQNPKTNERFFALTTQSENFKNLNPYKILGVAELYKPSENISEIEFLQTSPAYLNNIELPQIKHIGKAMIDCFKMIIKDKDISLYTTASAKSFYEKMGFKNIESNLMLLKR